MVDASRIDDPAPRLVNGVLYLEGVPRICLGTDYHYFRDDPANWRDRLQAQAESGVHILTLYVPWRHHAPEDPLRGDGAYDFDGRTDPRRDVKGLLRMAKEAGLQVFLKPGPFIHAELPYGGLPEYVRPDLNAAIEPELDGDGQPVVWAIRRMLPQHRHPLPAPFGVEYENYVRDWLSTVARELVAPHYWPDGPVVGLQLMNEGIYSDSSRAEPHQMGFSPSSLARFRAFVRDRYGTVARYNRCHGTRIADWSEVDPPRAAHTLPDTTALLAYLDWSAFQSTLYTSVADLYREYLVEGGMPENAPLVFNFNPNGSTYRQRPASNDGWYTRVNVTGHPCFTFGFTNWIGVVCGDPAAYRQFAMAATAWRGPAMELNWGFITLYDPPYSLVTPSQFETMAALAFGATGAVAYTLAGTQAWRDDPNLDGEWLPDRMSHRTDGTARDYPGAPPILSDGTRTPKYWTLRQIAQYLGHEGRYFLPDGPNAPVAWAIYPPYAWSGQWLPRGDPDDLLWRPPLKSVPRGAYHGLDAFVEMLTWRGIGFQQVDIHREDADLSGIRLLCLSAHEFMDEATQTRLADYVESGGRLLLTNLVPDKDEHLQPLRGPLAERLFPHTGTKYRQLETPAPVHLGGERTGFAKEFATVVEPPGDAEVLLELQGEPVGYRRRVGEGEVVFVGFGPWRAITAGDDQRVSEANQALMWRLIHDLGGEDLVPAGPAHADRELVVWRHGPEDAPEAHLFILARDTDGELEVEVASPRGGRHRILLRTPSQAGHGIALENGEVRACYLRGINDLRAEAVPPRVEAGGALWGAEEPCDLCITRSPDGSGLTVTVAHLQAEETRVHLPFPPDAIADVAPEHGAPAKVEPTEEGTCAIRVRDVREAGAYRVSLRPAAMAQAPAS